MRWFILWGIAGLAALLLPACKVTETEYIDSYYTRYQVVESGIPLGSAEDLAKIGVDPDYPLNGTYSLAADIDLSSWGSWEPIGTAQAFSGIFDGKGKTIRGLKLSGGTRDYTGLFGRLLNARLFDLTIEADTAAVLVSTSTDATDATTKTAVCAGVAAGYIDSSFINNITIRGTVVLGRAGTGDFDAGGLAGVIKNSDVYRVTVDMNLSVAGAPLHAGLIAGRTLLGTMAFCQAEGTLNASAPTGSLTVGGIVGDHTGLLENCTSAASVYAAGFDIIYVGGITGNSYQSTTPPVVSSCSLRSEQNHPITIQGKSLRTTGAANNVCAGGITGTGYVSKGLVDAEVEIIAEAVNHLVKLYAGGIAGDAIDITNSFVRRGAVRAKASAAVSYNNAIDVSAGGIAGRLTRFSKIEDCFSGADVTVEYAGNLTNLSGYIGVGGVVGGDSGAVSITKSGSSGTVSVVSSNSANSVPAFAGGIMGIHMMGTTSEVLTMRQCAALNPQITAESAGTVASAKAYTFRVLGSATTGTTSLTVLTPEAMLANANLTLGLNYGIPTTEIKTKSGAGGWETVPIPQENNSASYMGGNTPQSPLTQAFFENVLGWDFTATWGWDAAANLPYPLTN
jgi:hypothetical protein